MLQCDMMQQKSKPGRHGRKIQITVPLDEEQYDALQMVLAEEKQSTPELDQAKLFRRIVRDWLRLRAAGRKKGGRAAVD